MRYYNFVSLCAVLLLDCFYLIRVLSLYMQGVYDIIAMSGSFLNTESNGTVTRTSDMNVHIAGPDGRILAGFVAGMLVARSQVQVAPFLYI